MLCTLRVESLRRFGHRVVWLAWPRAPRSMSRRPFDVPAQARLPPVARPGLGSRARYSFAAPNRQYRRVIGPAAPTSTRTASMITDHREVREFEIEPNADRDLPVGRR